MRDETERIMKSLAYVIESIQRMPSEWQREDFQQHMIKLLDAMSEHCDLRPEDLRLEAACRLDRWLAAGGAT
jgi:hypothetical protein